MSEANEEGRNLVKSRCSKWIWLLFPHVCLIASLIGYAALGAVMFQKIEGVSTSNETSEEYRAFLDGFVYTVQNYSDSPNLIMEVQKKIRYEFKSIWLQEPERWSFWGSLFFCCTVFTTVGYGEIYPVTVPGKVMCILYAMVGIPLMLLVITNVGDMLAVLLSKAYLRLHTLCRPVLYHSWIPGRGREKAPQQDPSPVGAVGDGTYTFSHNMVVREPMDIRHVLQSQASVKRKSIHLHNNTEIFDRIIARENFGQNGPLVRTCSCPELDRMPPVPKDFALWDFSSIGQELDRLDVPLVLILLVVFTYILFGALILPLWEDKFDRFDSFYFCFITLTTIGFGDIVPDHPKFFMLTFLFIISGMAIMSMAFKLSQSRIVSCYNQCMRCVSGGKVVKYEELDSD